MTRVSRIPSINRRLRVSSAYGHGRIRACTRCCQGLKILTSLPSLSAMSQYSLFQSLFSPFLLVTIRHYQHTNCMQFGSIRRMIQTLVRLAESAYPEILSDLCSLFFRSLSREIIISCSQRRYHDVCQSCNLSKPEQTCSSRG